MEQATTKKTFACAACSKVSESGPKSLKRCACKKVWYCNPACQKAHWKLHRPKCAARKLTVKEELLKLCQDPNEAVQAVWEYMSPAYKEPTTIWQLPMTECVLDDEWLGPVLAKVPLDRAKTEAFKDFCDAVMSAMGARYARCSSAHQFETNYDGHWDAHIGAAPSVVTAWTQLLRVWCPTDEAERSDVDECKDVFLTCCRRAMELLCVKVLIKRNMVVETARQRYATDFSTLNLYNHRPKGSKAAPSAKALAVADTGAGPAEDAGEHPTGLQGYVDEDASVLRDVTARAEQTLQRMAVEEERRRARESTLLRAYPHPRTMECQGCGSERVFVYDGLEYLDFCRMCLAALHHKKPYFAQVELKNETITQTQYDKELQALKVQEQVTAGHPSRLLHKDAQLTELQCHDLTTAELRVALHARDLKYSELDIQTLRERLKRCLRGELTPEDKQSQDEAAVVALSTAAADLSGGGNQAPFAAAVLKDISLKLCAFDHALANSRATQADQAKQAKERAEAAAAADAKDATDGDASVISAATVPLLALLRQLYQALAQYSQQVVQVLEASTASSSSFTELTVEAYDALAAVCCVLCEASIRLSLALSVEDCAPAARSRDAPQACATLLQSFAALDTGEYAKQVLHSVHGDVRYKSLSEETSLQYVPMLVASYLLYSAATERDLFSAPAPATAAAADDSKMEQKQEKATVTSDGQRRIQVYLKHLVARCGDGFVHLWKDRQGGGGGGGGGGGDGSITQRVAVARVLDSKSQWWDRIDINDLGIVPRLPWLDAPTLLI